MNTNYDSFAAMSGGEVWLPPVRTPEPTPSPAPTISEPAASTLANPTIADKPISWGSSYAQRGGAWSLPATQIVDKFKTAVWGSLIRELPKTPKEPKEPKAKVEFENNPTQKICIIPGGTGHLGHEFALDAIKKGYKVIVTTRDSSKCQNSKDLLHIQASHREQIQPEFWKKLMGQFPQAESITIVNTVGAPTAPKGLTLRDVVVLPANAMAKAIHDVEIEDSNREYRFVHLSSIGTIMLKEDAYGETKRQGEEEILALGGKNTCIIRVGYAFQKSVKGEINKIDNTHAYGPEQLASLPFQPLLGNGKQLLQPIFTGDIVDAGLNFKDGVKVVNAIGHEVLTQDNFMAYFCELADKPFRPVHINLTLADFFAKHFPKGHFSPYAVEGCRRLEKEDMILDTKEFEELIGHKTATLNDVYSDLKGKPLYYAKPPIKEHMKEGVKIVLEKTFLDDEQIARNVENLKDTL